MSGLPPCNLQLKIGLIVIVLQNLNVMLCQDIWMGDNCINFKVHSSSAKGEWVFSRIDLIPSNITFSYLLPRHQFPVKLSFAISINKSQEQTLDKLVFKLPSPVYTHGELYVTMSPVVLKNYSRYKLTTTRSMVSIVEKEQKRCLTRDIEINTMLTVNCIDDLLNKLLFLK